MKTEGLTIQEAAQVLKERTCESIKDEKGFRYKVDALENLFPTLPLSSILGKWSLVEPLFRWEIKWEEASMGSYIMTARTIKEVIERSPVPSLKKIISIVKVKEGRE